MDVNELDQMAEQSTVLLAVEGDTRLKTYGGVDQPVADMTEAAAAG